MASSTPSNGISTSTITLGITAVLATAAVGYAIYFDNKRRSDPEFRKYLKKQHKKVSKLDEAASAAAERSQKEKIASVVAAANEEGFPRDPEDTEAYFMQEVARGESMCTDGSDPVDAALCFYKALKVYPQPRELISIYDKTVPKVSSSSAKSCWNRDQLTEMSQTAHLGYPCGDDRGRPKYICHRIRKRKRCRLGDRRVERSSIGGRKGRLKSCGG